MPIKQNKVKAKRNMLKMRAASKLRKSSKNDADAAGSKRILSAAELGVKAQSIGIKKGAKTQKGKKILESREPQIEEDTKRSVMLRGNKISNEVQQVIRDFHLMRGKDHSTLNLRKSRDLLPFEDCNELEHIVSKFNCSLFLLGTHQKKRPDNLIFGRLFSDHLLDMFEFAVQNYIPTTYFKAQEINYEIKPILLFQGEHFEFSPKHQRFKNFMIGK